jgi:hypothetical protein
MSRPPKRQSVNIYIETNPGQAGQQSEVKGILNQFNLFRVPTANGGLMLVSLLWQNI